MRVIDQYSAPAVCLSLAVLIIMVFFPTTACTGDWPSYGGPDRNWISKESGWASKWPDEGPTKLWEQEVGIGFSSFSVSQGRVYTMGWADDKDTVFCFDAETGKVIWTHSYAAPLLDKYYEGGPGGTPTVDDGRVYTMSKVGNFFCLDAATGKVIWSKDLAQELEAKIPEWAFAGSALIEGDWVIIEVGVIAAFDKIKGDLVWKTENYASAYSSPIAADLEGTRCLASFPEYGLVISDMKTGKELAKHRWETRYGVNAATPLHVGNKFFISSGYGKGCALLEVQLGKEPVVLWQSKKMRNHFNTSVIHQGFIYGFDEDTLRCLEFDTGKVRWAQEDLGKGSLMLADGILIVLSEKGELLTVTPSPDGFQEISRAQVLGGKCWTVPVLANGQIYCRNAAGNVVCVDVKNK